MAARAFIIFGAELPWVYPLAVELAAYGPATGISLGASLSPRRRKVVWPFDDSSHVLRREVWTYPPGFNGKLAPLFTRAVRARLRAAARRLQELTHETPIILTPNPRLLPYLRDLDGCGLVYLNHDDYTANRGKDARAALCEETELVGSADWVFCSSQYQTLRFRERFPAMTARIFHLPHGVHESFINPDPSRPPEPNTVCSVGYLSSRYDWSVIHDVVGRLPEVRFSFVGEIINLPNSGQRADWLELLQSTLQMPNVVHVRGLRHRETAPHYWTSAVNWMPYRDDLAFVKASCPLKLTDGLAAGRPIVSSDVPECRLYPEWVNVYRDASHATDLIQSALATTNAIGAIARTCAQIEFAKANTWQARSRRLVELLSAHPAKERRRT